MKKLKLLAVTAALALAACGGGGADALVKLKDEACACKDKACADAVEKKIEETLNKMSEPDEETGKKLMSVMADAAACLGKLQAGGGDAKE